MKVTVITVSYNCAGTIRNTIESVLSQAHPDLEYIIVDGQSTDGTLDIIRSYAGRGVRYVSEPDKGLYDAMNKGIRMATGEVVGILNADDIYTDAHVIEDVASTFANPRTDCIYADLAYVQAEDVRRVVRYWQSGRFRPGAFRKGWMPPHPTFFVRRRAYETYGLFDLNFRSSADYELMLRYLYKHRMRASYLPRVIVRMRAGGKSNSSLENRMSANREDRRAWQKNNLNPPFYTLFLKPMRKIGQYLMPTERTPATAKTFRYMRQLGL